MKRLSSIMVGTAITLLTMNSCTNEVSEPMLPVQENDVFEYTFTTRGFERADESDSRTAMIMPENENENALAVWSKGDTIGIAPNTGAQAFFVIDYGAESNSATFSGGAWALKPDGDNDYAAYYPFVYDVILDRTKVPVDFTGQVYKPAIDNKLSCLAKYDFMAAKATKATSASNVSFDFKHLGVLTEIQFAVPAAGEVTQVTLTADEKIFPIKGTFNLEAETVAIIPSADLMSNTLAIDVEGLETTTDNETVSVFFMMAPVNLSGKVLNLDIICNGETETLAVSNGKDMLAGKWYTLTAGETDKQPAYIQLESDFSVGLNDALGTLGGTKLKFVANSNTTSETVVFEDAINKVNAYAVRNGDWLEVHTVAKEFMAPESCEKAFCGGSYYSYPNFSSLAAIDLTGLNTSNVINMEGMFSFCYSLESITFGNGFTTSNVTNMHSMFGNCLLLTSLDLSGFETSKVTDMTHLFIGCRSLVSLDLSSFNTASVTFMQYMFSGCDSLTSIVFGDRFDTSHVTWMINMFRGCSSLASIDLSKFETSSVKYMGGMFEGCSSLTAIDLSSFDTPQLTDASGMFCDCTSLESITFGENFDTSGVLSMDGMFNGCSSLDLLDLSSFDASSVESMSFMFTSCTALETVVFGDGFKTPSLTSMDWMFEGCSSLVSVDMSNFDTSSVTTMSGLFNGCISLEAVDLSSFDTSNVESMSIMFKDCKKLASLDLSGFTFLEIYGVMSVGCSDMFDLTGSECENKPINIYVTAEGKQYLERETKINPSYAKLVVKDNKD